MKNQIKKLVAHAITHGAIVLAAPVAMASPQLVSNGDFSAGSTGWSGPMQVSNGWGVGGSQAMVTGCVGNACVSTLGSGYFFGQTISTTAGASYDLSFLVGENGGQTSEFTVFWNGLKVADVINPANGTIDFVTNRNMVSYAYSLVATGASTAFEIHGHQDPAGISFDNVSVTQSSAEVPEPGSMMLIGAGLLGLVARRKLANRI